MGLAAYAGWCSDPNCCRAGEAKHPGPRRSQARDPLLSLEARPLYSDTSSLLGAGQRLNWCMRGQLGPAWELVSRWERLQPVRHRTPVPEVILKSLVVLAWLKGFRRWAACTLLAYFGLARIGEVLRATRLHLLLPEDHCSVLTGCVS